MVESRPRKPDSGRVLPPPTPPPGQLPGAHGHQSVHTLTRPTNQSAPTPTPPGRAGACVLRPAMGRAGSLSISPNPRRFAVRPVYRVPLRDRCGATNAARRGPAESLLLPCGRPKTKPRSNARRGTALSAVGSFGQWTVGTYYRSVGPALKRVEFLARADFGPFANTRHGTTTVWGLFAPADSASRGHDIRVE